jgi:(p)ppGpp synthase/HD superfamily hydrolase
MQHFNLIKEAEAFAKEAHGTQRRKYTGEPYWHHLRNVAALVAEQTDDEEIIAAAWLHDTIEDTQIDHGILRANFGPRVANLVLELTDVYTHERFPEMNRAARKAAEALRLGRISDDARLIKLADIKDNTADIEERDPAFAKIYLAEKEEIFRQWGIEP